MHALAFGGNLDRDDLVHHLDPALDLCRLGRLIPEPVDEGLHALDLVVLLALLLPEALHARLALDEEVAVVPGVIGELAQTDLGDARHDGVEEEAVVGDENHRVRVVGEVLLEPVARLEIEVIGGLVEEQQSRPRQEQLGQRDAHLPAAGKCLAWLVEVVGREPETAEHRRDLEVDVVAFEAPEVLLQLAVLAQHVRVLGLVSAVVAEAFFQRLNLGAHIEQRLEGQPGFFQQGSAAVRQAVLRQVADDQP